MFEEIKGQQSAVFYLDKALIDPVHTYLFVGSRGTFIEESARLFAAQLIGLNEDAIERANKKLHPDIIEYEPIGVTYKVKEDVRDQMLVQSRKTPVETSKQVLIVHDAHLLRQDSANTLLKSLEEPSDNTHWILIAPSIDSILPTIRSRSFVISFDRLSNELIVQELIESGINEKLAREISSRCSGRMDRAKALSKEFYPIIETSKYACQALDGSMSSVVNAAKAVMESFDNVSSDVIKVNKDLLADIKKDVKDSGYSDRVASSIVTQNKNRIEAQEKRLKTEMMKEFLDALEFEYRQIAIEDSGNKVRAVEAISIIEEYKKRLTYNPSESLYLEALFSRINDSQSVKS